MNFEESGACGINKRQFEVSMTAEEVEQYTAFLDWAKDNGQDLEVLTIQWNDEDEDADERTIEKSEDLFNPMFKILDSICDDIPDDAEFKPLVEEMTDNMAAYFES